MVPTEEALEWLAIIGANAPRGALLLLNGEVKEYDPDTQAAIVTLQPEGIETPELKVMTPWVGLQVYPEVGQPCHVLATLEGVFLGVMAFYYNADATPPSKAADEAIEPGEFWLVHKLKETCVKLLNSGILLLGGNKAVQVVSPKVELGAADLSGDDAVVRKSDLKKVADEIQVVKDWLLGPNHTHLGNMGAPTPINPAAAATLLPNSTKPDLVGGSSVVKAKG